MIKSIASMVATYVGLVCAGIQTFGPHALGPVTYALLAIPAVILGLVGKAIISGSEGKNDD